MSSSYRTNYYQPPDHNTSYLPLPQPQYNGFSTATPYTSSPYGYQTNYSQDDFAYQQQQQGGKKSGIAGALASFKAMDRKKQITTVLVTVIILGISIALIVFKDKIVNAFLPLKVDVHKSSAPWWLVPVGVLVLISIPPLFGHEIVLLIVGLIWGWLIGFGIAALGTVVGETLTFFLSKTILRKYSEKERKKSVTYAALSKMMLNEGIWVLALIRYSMIPGHLITALQATIGVSYWKYLIAIILSLPKQFVLVYLGTTYEITEDKSNPDYKRDKIISIAVTVITIIVTIFASRIIKTRREVYVPEVEAEFAAAAASSHSGDSEALIGNAAPMGKGGFEKSDVSLRIPSPSPREMRSDGTERVSPGELERRMEFAPPTIPPPPAA